MSITARTLAAAITKARAQGFISVPKMATRKGGVWELRY